MYPRPSPERLETIIKMIGEHIIQNSYRPSLDSMDRQVNISHEMYLDIQDTLKDLENVNPS